jgi:hypothetical protein
MDAANPPAGDVVAALHSSAREYRRAKVVGGSRTHAWHPAAGRILVLSRNSASSG